MIILITFVIKCREAMNERNCSYQTVLETHMVICFLCDADGFLQSQISLLTAHTQP